MQTVPVVITDKAARAIVCASTLVVSTLMQVLCERGHLSDEDVVAVVEGVRNAGRNDLDWSGLANLMADALASQFVPEERH